MLQDLPTEVVLEILQLLDLKEVCRLGITCGSLSRITSDEKIWFNFIDRHFFRKEKFNKEFQQFLYDLSQTFSWKLCYCYLFKIQNFRPAFFWDDVHMLSSVDEKRTYLSVMAQNLVQTFLEDVEEDCWTVNENQLQQMAIILASITENNFAKFFRVLLNIGMGPYRISKTELHYFFYTTHHLNAFYRLRYFAELHWHQNCTDNSSRSFQKHSEDFTKQLKKQNYFKDSIEVFNAPQKKVEKAVLCIFVSYFRETKISLTAMSKIHSILKFSFRSNRWSSNTHAIRQWIIVLAAKLMENKAAHTYTEDEGYQKYLKKNLFDFDVPENIVALNMTSSDQINLLFYKLNEYVDSHLRDKGNNHNEIFRYLHLPEKEQYGVKKLLKLQDVYIPTIVLKYFEQPTTENKPRKIQRLLNICEILFQYNNFFSLKVLLQGVRGVLTWKSKTKLSWSDISYYHLKKFVKLEKLVEADNDYAAYKELMVDMKSHCIPILHVHLRDIEKSLREVITPRQNIVSPIDHQWYYNTLTNETKSCIEQIATLYYRFVRR